MPSDEQSKILPPMMGDPQKPQVNRTVLGVLLAVLFVAILLALWFLLFDGDDESTTSGSNDGQAAPTSLTIPTSTPTPAADAGTGGGDLSTSTGAPTTAPVMTPTPVPEGFEACDDTRAPLTTQSYIVDTNTTPLNQRAEPAVTAEQAGTFDPGQTGLVFTGECVVNLADGYVWWQINNGTVDVWVASDFVTPS